MNLEKPSSILSKPTDLFALKTKCKSFELLRCPNSSEPLEQVNELNDESLCTWLEKVYGLMIYYRRSSKLMGEFRALEPLTTRLRFLRVGSKFCTLHELLTRTAVSAPPNVFRIVNYGREDCKFSEEEGIPFGVTKASLELIGRYFHFPQAFRTQMRAETCSAYCFSVPDKTLQQAYGIPYLPSKSSIGTYLCLTWIGIVLKLPMTRAQTHSQIAMIYEMRERSARALMMAPAFWDYAEISELLMAELRDKSSMCSHPLTIPLALVEVVLTQISSRLYKMETELRHIFASTGQHTYHDVPVKSPLELNFIECTRSLNHLSKKIGSEAALLESLMHAMSKIREFGQIVTKSLIQEKENAETFSSSIAMEEILECSVEFCRSLLISSAYLEKRSATLLQVVGSLRSSLATFPFILELTNRNIGIPIHGPERCESQYHACGKLGSYRQG